MLYPCSGRRTWVSNPPAVALGVFEGALHLFAKHFGEDGATDGAATGSGDVGGAIAAAKNAVERLLDPFGFEIKTEGIAKHHGGT
jgi:hypothetical protein